MMAAKSNQNGNVDVSRTIRKEIGKGANRRQLSRMPAFQPVEYLPDHLRQLLARLEQSESMASS